MTCLTPVWRSKPLYGYQNGEIRPIAQRMFLCGCGKCIPCLMAEQRDWAFRLQLQAEVSETAYFITLTYDDEHLPQDNVVQKSEIQRFMNTLRKKLERVCKERSATVPKLSYYAVGEYGKKSNRAHYHMMLFNMPIHSLGDMYRLVSDVWQRGFVKVEFCSSQNSNYLCKYMTKLDPREHKVKPFRLMSRRPAIGYEYFLRPEILEYINRPDVISLRFRDGRNHRIPRSVRRKFYTIEKQLAICDEVAYTPEQVVAMSSDYVKMIEVGASKNADLVERIRRKFVF